jgi:hypothetical protein
MKDDEYTRTVVALDVRAAKNSVARQKLPAIIRSLQRPTARAFADYLASQSSRTRILGLDGTPMGQRLRVDGQRVNKTGEHIMLGLYFIERGRPIPKSAEVKLESMQELDAYSPGMLTIARVFGLFPDHRDGAMGAAFSYAAAFGYERSVWLMLLYDYHFWVGSIDERDISERASAPEPVR